MSHVQPKGAVSVYQSSFLSQHLLQHAGSGVKENGDLGYYPPPLSPPKKFALAGIVSHSIRRMHAERLYWVYNFCV